jgi:ATP-dependent protease Clp ATPase subunit
MMKLWKLRCSFCKKSDADISKLVAGPGVYICDECVSVASRLMDAPPPALERRSSWHRMSSHIRRVLGVDRTHTARSIPTS